MGTEIERKFLVRDDSWRGEAGRVSHLRQGYIAIDGGNAARVRTDGERAWLALKGPADGLARPEFEYAIPLADADGLLAICRERVVEKRRHIVVRGGSRWEIDEFMGHNAGLVLAELELATADQVFERPEWLGPEVSSDPRYTNAALSTHPFGAWPRSAKP
jgi:CYTH domain-containing protein